MNENFLPTIQGRISPLFVTFSKEGAEKPPSDYLIQAQAVSYKYLGLRMDNGYPIFLPEIHI